LLLQDVPDDAIHKAAGDSYVVDVDRGDGFFRENLVNNWPVS